MAPQLKTPYIIVLGCLLVALLLFMYVIPITHRTGVIDTTQNICSGLPPVTKRYHILFGQKKDYNLVKPHLIDSQNRNCGQRADFRLYL